MIRFTRPTYALAIIFASVLLMTLANMIYTGHVQRQNNQKWCSLMTSLDQPDPQPTTERGRQIQEQIHELRRGLGCRGDR